MHNLRLSLSSVHRAGPWPITARLCALASLLTTTAVWSQTTLPLPSTVQTALRTAQVPTEAMSVWVAPAEGGAPSLTHGAQTVRPIASVMKLFTTGSALYQLGPAWTWHTDTALQGALLPNGSLAGNVHVRGSGDPSLRMEQVYLMMNRWHASGLRHIQGDIVLDRSALHTPPHDPYAFDGQGLRPYNAGPDALLLNHQSVTLQLESTSDLAAGTQVSMLPALAGVSVSNALRPGAGPCGDWRSALRLTVEPTSGSSRHGLPPWRVHIKGTYPTACGKQTWPVLWPQQGQFAARLLTQTWLQNGGTLQGRVREGEWPHGFTPWQSWESEPLPQVIRDINKFSNNVMAKQVFLAQSRTTPATYEDAQAQLTNTVQSLLKQTGSNACQPGQLTADNGSGLSRRESSSAACLGAWLQVMWRSPHMADFVASLPITSVDGTTRRWQGAAGFARIKTGSLSGVAAMAGYVDDTRGQRHAVVALIQHPNAGAARPAFDALLDWTRAQP